MFLAPIRQINLEGTFVLPLSYFSLGRVNLQNLIIGLF